MSPFELIIKNSDGSVYWTERFPTQDSLNKWLNDEQSRPYWKKDFQIEYVDNTEAIALKEKQLENERDAIENEQREKSIAMRAAVKTFRDKPSKTIADVAKLLDMIIDKLGLGDDQQ